MGQNREYYLPHSTKNSTNRKLSISGSHEIFLFPLIILLPSRTSSGIVLGPHDYISLLFLASARAACPPIYIVPWFPTCPPPILSPGFLPCAPHLYCPRVFCLPLTLLASIALFHRRTHHYSYSVFFSHPH